MIEKPLIQVKVKRPSMSIAEKSTKGTLLKTATICSFVPLVLTKNHTAFPLRKTLDRVNQRVIVRIGSLTELPKGKEQEYKNCIQINTTKAIRTSSSKILMKEAFAEHNVTQATWGRLDNYTIEQKDKKNIFKYRDQELEFPIVLKRVFGRQGMGMMKIDTPQELNTAISKINIREYIVEKFYNYFKEYRIHVSKRGFIMAWRKLRKEEATERWFFNSLNCNWVGEDHELFKKPDNWDVLIDHSMRALQATDLYFGACDVRVNNKGEFIVCEINSAPSLGDKGITLYRETLNLLIQDEINKKQ